MKIKKKADAFTLSEALVALLISMLVITCMLSLYTYINGNVKSTLDHYSLNQEVVRASFFLKQNLLRAESVKLIEDGGIDFITDIGDESIYQLSINTIIKQRNIVDSLSFSSRLMDTIFTGNSLSQVTVKMQTKQHPYFLILSKKYNRNYLINQVQRYEHFIKSATSE